jgi:hypothetical protein
MTRPDGIALGRDREEPIQIHDRGILLAKIRKAYYLDPVAA